MFDIFLFELLVLGYRDTYSVSIIHCIDSSEWNPCYSYPSLYFTEIVGSRSVRKWIEIVT